LVSLPSSARVGRPRTAIAKMGQTIQGVSWCGGRDGDMKHACCQEHTLPSERVEFAEPLAKIEQVRPEASVQDRGGTSPLSKLTPTQAMREALARKAASSPSEIIAPMSRSRINRSASSAEADARWQATRDAWEQQLRASIEAQEAQRQGGSSGSCQGAGTDSPMSKEDERRAALAMFKTEAREEEHHEFVEQGEEQHQDEKEALTTQIDDVVQDSASPLPVPGNEEQAPSTEDPEVEEKSPATVAPQEESPNSLRAEVGGMDAEGFEAVENVQAELYDTRKTDKDLFPQERDRAAVRKIGVVGGA